MHVNINVRALPRLLSKGYDSCVYGRPLLWKTNYELVSFNETRDLFRWLDTQRSEARPYARDRT